MSLHVAAQHLASKGRKGDTELVHMTKGEIKGLQALALAHGGSLSTNPDTGLVEASFLKNLLPMIAGIGLNMMFPGSGALIGLGVGGFEAARTGDIGKGLMAGLGAYGGANIGSALASAAPGATTSLAPATTNIASEGARNVGADIIRTNVGAGVQGGMSTFPGAENAVLSNFQTTASPTLANMGAGAKEIFSNPDAAMAFGKQNIGSIGSAVAPVLSGAMTPKPVDPLDPEKSSGKYISDNFQAYVPPQPNPYYRPRGLGYTGYAAEGGMMPDDLRYANGGMVNPMQQMPSGGLATIEGMRDGYGPMTTMDGNIPQMADGGSIGGYSDGGRMLKGPGDGMSDSIPGVIGNKQPARLADGEFVMPADVVSHLGNGSTDAGAKKLYSMMDKVRKARTGTKKQGKQIKPEKYMPA
jgi:hypothetical protein